jgi:hypothetical protein
MNQNKNQQRGKPGQQGQGNAAQSTHAQHPDRDKAEGDRESASGGGISNRGMDSDEEQEDLPARGSERRDRDDAES